MTQPSSDRSFGQATERPYLPPAAERPLGQPSVGDLLSTVSEDLSTLVRQELALAKAEARLSATRAGRGVGMLGEAAVAAHFMLLFVSIAGWWALGNAIGRGWSALVVALVWAVIAAVLAAKGRSELRSTPGLPQTSDTVKRVPSALTPHSQEKP